MKQTRKIVLWFTIVAIIVLLPLAVSWQGVSAEGQGTVPTVPTVPTLPPPLLKQVFLPIHHGCCTFPVQQ